MQKLHNVQPTRPPAVHSAEKQGEELRELTSPNELSFISSKLH